MRSANSRKKELYLAEVRFFFPSLDFFPQAKEIKALKPEMHQSERVSGASRRRGAVPL